MKISLVQILFLLVAAGAAFLSLDPGHTWYLTLIAAAAIILAAFIQQDSDDNRIFTLAFGEIVVIAIAAESFWVSFMVQCAVIGAVMFDGRFMGDTVDRRFFWLYCIIALLCTIIFDRSVQVLIPFLMVTTIVAVTTFILVGFQEMRERRMYAGGNK